jgi:hypothetical protein
MNGSLMAYLLHSLGLVRKASARISLTVPSFGVLLTMGLEQVAINGEHAKAMFGGRISYDSTSSR